MRVIQNIQNPADQLNITGELKAVGNAIGFSVACFILYQLAAKSFRLLALLFKHKRNGAEKKELISKCESQKQEILYLENALSEARVTEEKLKNENLILKNNIRTNDALCSNILQQAGKTLIKTIKNKATLS